MNVVILQGRLTRDPEIRYTQGENQTAIARYTLAVDRYRKGDGNSDADFISCVAFRKAAEFAEKYLHKGMKISIRGRIQTSSYTNREGVKVYTTDVVVEEHHFCESKQAGGSQQAPAYGQTARTHQTPTGTYNGQAGYQNPGQGYTDPSPNGQGYGTTAAGSGMNRPGTSVPNSAAVPAKSPGYAGRSSAPAYAGPAGPGYSHPDGGYSAPGGNSNSGQGYVQDPNYQEGFMNIPDGIDEELPFD